MTKLISPNSSLVIAMLVDSGRNAISTSSQSYFYKNPGTEPTVHDVSDEGFDPDDAELVESYMDKNQLLIHAYTVQDSVAFLANEFDVKFHVIDNGDENTNPTVDILMGEKSERVEFKENAKIITKDQLIADLTEYALRQLGDAYAPHKKQELMEQMPPELRDLLNKLQGGK